MKCKTCGQEVGLKVGDRVEAIGEVSGINLKGNRGVVKRIDSQTIKGNNPVLVEFDKPLTLGHDGYGDCKDGHGRWGEHEDFKVIKKGVKKPLDTK